MQPLGYPAEMADILHRTCDLLLDLGRNPDTALATIPELYTEDMTFRDPIQEVHGRDAFVEVTRRLIDRTRSIEVRVHHSAHSGDAMFIAWTMSIAFPIGPQVDFEGVSHFGLKDDRIATHRDHFDLLGSMIDAVPGVRSVYRLIVSRFG